MILCEENPPVTGGFPSQKGQWHGALMFSLNCAWTNGWINNQVSVIWDAIALIMLSLQCISIALFKWGNPKYMQSIHKSPLIKNFPNKKQTWLYFTLDGKTAVSPVR